jgi:cytochrome c-type biogenesis protein CcmH
MNSSSLWIFVALAVLLAAVFGASLYGASRRGSRDGVAAPRGQSLTLMLAAPIAVAALYVALGQPAALSSIAGHPATDGTPPDPNVMVQSLAARLKEHPEDLDGWIMLARSYAVLDRYPEAADAYEHAQAKVMQDGGLLANWIELRVILNGRKFDARSLELLDHAIALTPDSADVLLLRALAALQRGDKTGAAPLIDKLHQQYPPGSPDRQSLDAMLANWPGPETENQPPANPVKAAQQPASATPTPDIGAMVERLASHLKEHPEDMNGWIMLARSYSVLGRDAEAATAYEHAQTQVMQDSALLTRWIQLRLQLSQGKFDARTHELVDRAADLAPDDATVLLLRALAASDRGDKAGAQALADKLRQRFPPGSPERQNLDAALEKWIPQAPGK